VAIWAILRPFGIFSCHLVLFIAIWRIFWPFGTFSPFCYAEPKKSGNPGDHVWLSP
jgi:hypothetical protein